MTQEDYPSPRDLAYQNILEGLSVLQEAGDYRTLANISLWSLQAIRLNSSFFRTHPGLRRKVQMARSHVSPLTHVRKWL